VLPLLERLPERGPAILLTTGTVTAAHIAARRLPADAIHQFVPMDMPEAIKRFLDYWMPGLVLFAESELWPTTLKAISDRGMPLVLVNARMSERSFRSWRAGAPFARSILRRVELCLAKSPADAERLGALGAGRVVVSGNLKFDAPPPLAEPAEVVRTRREIGDRLVLLAASTHPGEEAQVIAAHVEMTKSGAKLLTILAPRHPERGEALAAEIAQAGLSFRRRSLGQRIDAGVDIYLADTIGEMGLWYRVADLAFLGGSMAPRGGQNPIEPAKLGVPILHGEHVENFRDVYDALTAAKAVVAVRNGASLAAAVRRLMSDQTELQRLACAAHACVDGLTGALERTLKELEPYLSALDHDHAA
jgi:3-deoxy-D-manno-octulosonic-acid transferase